MGSINRWFRRGASAACLGACLSACVTDAWPRWSPPGFDAPASASPYADALTARYAALVKDRDRSAELYARALARAEDDPGLLDNAVLAALLSVDAEGAAAIASRARPDALAQAPFARLVRVVDLIRSGRDRQARALLEAGAFGPLDQDAAAALRLVLDGVRRPEAAVELAKQGPASTLPERSEIAVLILDAGGRTREARAHFASLTTTPAPESFAAESKERAAAGDAAGALEVLKAAGRTIDTDPQLTATLTAIRAGGAMARSTPSTAHLAAAALHLTTSRGALASRPEIAGAFASLVVMLDPGHDRALFGLARALIRQGREDAAQSVLSRIGPDRAFSAPARLEEAWMAQRNGRTDRVVEHVEAALASPGASRTVKVGAGDVLAASDRMAEAERIYSEVVAQDQVFGAADWRVLHRRASARTRLDRWPEAEADLKAALAIAPDEPELLNHLGYGWVDRRERVEEGLALIERAIEKAPDRAHIVDSLGWALHRLGRHEAAVEALERASTLAPADPVILDHLGDAYRSAGRARDAHFAWMQALLFAPPADVEAAIRAKIGKGLPAAPGTSYADRSPETPP